LAEREGGVVGDEGEGVGSFACLSFEEGGEGLRGVEGRARGVEVEEEGVSFGLGEEGEGGERRGRREEGLREEREEVLLKTGDGGRGE
jgi:hypothetical protein